MSRSHLTDRCECSYRPGVPAVAPSEVIYTDVDALLAIYHCALCGRWWTCAWNARSAGWPALIPLEYDESRPTLEQLP